jgi:alpha-glucuronidase
MVDNSANEDRAVESYYQEETPEERRAGDMAAFIKAARHGDMNAPSPISYGHKNATVADMMMFSLNLKGGVTLSDIFAFIGKLSKDGDDDAIEMLEKMADQFSWGAA